ncbi:hypothetical protein H5A43_07410 [Pectobacterium brasiliense]|nr:hypothetical protein [Pectobacterium brasiliense]
MSVMKVFTLLISLTVTGMVSAKTVDEALNDESISLSLEKLAILVKSASYGSGVTCFTIESRPIVIEGYSSDDVVYWAICDYLNAASAKDATLKNLVNIASPSSFSKWWALNKKSYYAENSIMNVARLDKEGKEAGYSIAHYYGNKDAMKKACQELAEVNLSDINKSMLRLCSE